MTIEEVNRIKVVFDELGIESSVRISEHVRDHKIVEECYIALAFQGQCMMTISDMKKFDLLGGFCWHICSRMEQKNMAQEMGAEEQRHA